MKKNGATLLLKSLLNQEIETVFGVPGESYLSVLDALNDFPEISWIGARQEGGAAFMASGYAQLTGKTGICFVTRAPGATNASIGVHTAFQGSIPMILFIGQVSSMVTGREAFQELNYNEMYSGMAKWVTEINNVNRIPEIVSRAFNIANTGRPGPVIVSLPEDIISMPCEMNPSLRIRFPEPSISNFDIDEIRQKLSIAKKPIFIVGGTAWKKDGIRNLKCFIEQNNLPVISAFRRQDIFDNLSLSYAGVLSFGNSEKLNKAVYESDLVFAFNTLLGDVTTSGYKLIQAFKDKVLIHSNTDPKEISKVYYADLPIHSGPNNLALELKKLGKIGDWNSHTKNLHSEYNESLLVPNQPGNVDMGKIISYLQYKLPEDVIITNGAGNFSTWSNLLFKFGSKARLIAPTSGAMGFGLPAAIASKIAFPNKMVICFSGDGDFQMNISELGTAKQYNAFPIILLLNNSSYGTIRMHQEKIYPGRVMSTDIVNPSYTKIAEAYGMDAYQIKKTKEFKEVFDKVYKSKKGALIELIIDIESITPHKTLQEYKKQA